MHLAVRDANFEFVDALLLHCKYSAFLLQETYGEVDMNGKMSGADASPRLNKDDFTPLHSAAYQRDPRIARLLVQYNADVKAM